MVRSDFSAGHTHSSAAERARCLSVLLVKRLITPPPPRLVAIDVEKELRNLLAQVPKRHGVPDCVVRALPGLDILIDAIEQPQFLGEERPDLREPFLRIDTSVQPREVAASHDEISKYPAVALVQCPCTAVMIYHDGTLATAGRCVVAAPIPPAVAQQAGAGDGRGRPLARWAAALLAQRQPAQLRGRALDAAVRGVTRR